MIVKKTTFIICLILIGIGTFWYSTLKSDNKDLVWVQHGKLEVLPSIYDEIGDNSLRCGAFQLAWNDLIKDIEISSQSQYFNNLNRQNFSWGEISPNNYYNKYWLFTLDLKTDIEKWVKDKFNESIELPNFLSDWWIVPQSADYYEWKKEVKYWIYSKFKKIVDLRSMFETWGQWKFANFFEDINYYGINCNSNKQYEQVKILYYNTDDDFAISITTWKWDDIILSRWAMWTSFYTLYNNILNRAKNYYGNQNLTKYDCLKIPELSIKTEKEFQKFNNQKILDTGWLIHRIKTVIQNIEIKIDKVAKDRNDITSKNENDQSYTWTIYHHFYLDQPFVLFIRESDKDLPYLAAQISDVTLFQK